MNDTEMILIGAAALFILSPDLLGSVGKTLDTTSHVLDTGLNVIDKSLSPLDWALSQTNTTNQWDFTKIGAQYFGINW